MMWLRKGLIGLLSLVLLVSLVGVAFSTSTNLVVNHPGKIESWLSQSNFYQHFVSNAIDQAKKSAGSSENQGSVTLSDAAVQQAAESAFSIQLLQSSVKTFLASNYDWLEGKTAQPSFTIDLTNAKQSFANQVGQYVQAHISSLPVCTPQQLAELGNIDNVDPLNITCRPADLSAQAEGALVTDKINTSSDFLSNPVITANNINPNGGSQSKPYYQKLSKAPKLYQFTVKLPWIYAVAALLSTLSIIFLAVGKRRGLRRVGFVLAEAGIILVVVKFLADILLKYLEKRIFNQANVGQLQQVLTSFLRRVEHQWVRIELWFGIAYLLLALVIFIILRRGRRTRTKPFAGGAATSSEPGPSKAMPNPPQIDSPPRPTPTGPPTRPKKPRLIQ